MATVSKEKKTDKWLRFIKIFIANWGRSKVPQNAAQTTYYALLSLFPLLLVIANIIPLFPIDLQELLLTLDGVLPDNIYQIIAPILTNYLNSSSGGVLSIGVITAIWSSSILINSLRFVLNDVYDVEDTNENALLGRIIAPLIMVFLILIVMLLGIVFIFGEQILNFIKGAFEVELAFIDTFMALKWPVSILVLFIVFVFLYQLIPDHDLRIRDGLPGALFTTIAFMLLSELFTLYTQFSGSGDVGNAAIGTVLVLMLYMYFVSIIVLVGGLLNSAIYEFRHHHSVREDKLEEVEDESQRKLSQIYSLDNQPILLHEIKKVYPKEKLLEGLEDI